MKGHLTKVLLALLPRAARFGGSRDLHPQPQPMPRVWLKLLKLMAEPKRFGERE